MDAVTPTPEGNDVRGLRLTPEYLQQTLREVSADNDAAATDLQWHIEALEAELAAMDRPAHIRRAVLAAHAAVLRMKQTRSRRVLLRESLKAFGELESILGVLSDRKAP